MSHVRLVPIARFCGGSIVLGLKKIEVLIPRDWKTSKTLVPKMIRRYGRLNFFFDRRIVHINKQDPIKDRVPVEMMENTLNAAPIVVQIFGKF